MYQNIDFRKYTKAFSTHLPEKELHRLCTIALKRFQNITRMHALFHFSFAFLFLIELFTLIVTFSSLFTRTFFAFSLAAMFLTAFSYFSLRLYFQAKKPLQFRQLCADYLATCQDIFLSSQSAPPSSSLSETYDRHLAIAHAAYIFATKYLYQQEYFYYTVPKLFSSLQSGIEKVSCWLYWRDVHAMEELFLIHSIHQYIEIVRCKPTSLESHALLANGYILLSHLYIDPRKLLDEEEERWIPPERLSEEMQKKYRIVAKRAVEEFTILSHYAPKDPWVHKQLAFSYHDLKMPEKEIAQYEKVLQLVPDDHKTLFKLGILYFQQGMNAQGLQVYEQFKQKYPERAKTLMQFYGAHQVVDAILPPLQSHQ